jgi:GT2 family glycosyltransferase
MNTIAPFRSSILARVRRLPLLMYGVLFMTLGTAMYLFGVLLGVPRGLLGLNEQLLPLNTWIVWRSGIPMIIGIALAMLDLFVLLPAKRNPDNPSFEDTDGQSIVVALTAYNDQESIVEAVQDFLAHPRVSDVIVVSNNSSDETLARAAGAGAVAINEPLQGYGRCVVRCFSEAIARHKSSLIVLCEGDRTFRAYDIDKLLVYARHADIVNGTRTVESLRARHTQLSTFMYYGNLFVAKLLEAKHVGRSTLTDVGTTYKLCRREALVRLLPLLRPDLVNLEFNAYFLDMAIANRLAVLECPITFHRRVGESKGGNSSNWRALQVGIRMIRGIVLGWPEKR